MPGLTVAEKNHWRDRIAARLDKRIELARTQHPAVFDRIARESHQQALSSLGLAQLYNELLIVRNEEQVIAREKKQTQKGMIATLRGIPVTDVDDSIYVRSGTELGIPHDVAVAITRRQSAHTQTLLAADPIGQQVLRLEAEKDNLLDTVWLATSPSQIKELWTRVTDLLGDDRTPLEHDALSIPSPPEA